MGLSTAPNSFQLLMDKVLHGLTFRSALCYLDDVIICSDTFDSHMKDLAELFERFEIAGLKLNPSKCSFAQQKCTFLGHVISKDGLSAPPDRVEAIQRYPVPSSVSALRRFLGMVGWFRKYIPNFSSIADPLFFLLKKGVHFHWTRNHEESFQELKKQLSSFPILAYPRFDLQFRIAVDTSSRGIGFMLYQLHPEEDGSTTPHVVRYGSKSLSKWQRSYGPTKLELLGMTYAVLECASYIRGTHFIVECDHQALKPLYQKKLKGAIYERWLAILQEFNFDILYKPAKEMSIPDALSRDLPGNSDTNFDSPDQEDLFFPYIKEECGNIYFQGGQRLTQGMLNTCPKEINHLQVRSKLIQDNGYDADTDEPTAAIIAKQCRKSLHLPLQRKPIVGIPFKDVPHLKSVVNEHTVHNISASDSDTVIHNANSSNIDTSVCDQNVHLDSCKHFACDNQPTYFDAGIARDSKSSDRKSIDTVNRDTISEVNSNDCSDYVNNSCAHDVYSDVTCELRNSGVTSDSDHIM